MRERRFARFAPGLLQRRVEHLFDERGFARARDASQAHELAQRDTQVDVLEIVRRDTVEFDRIAAKFLIGGVASGTIADGVCGAERGQALAPGEPGASERGGVGGNLRRRAVAYDAAAVLAGAGTQVE